MYGSESGTPLNQPQRMRVICIGAGLGGIAATYKYQHDLENVDFVVYEKNPDVGGTWLENRYPGCACDIPAHGYTFSWEGNPKWSRFYAEAEEIFDYFKGCAVKWDCMRYIKLNHKVIEAVWDETSSLWKLTIENGDGSIIHDQCNVLINACGVLNNWRWPEIKGIETFQGKLLHSARWDQGYDFTGKRVAVIGAGSSAIQIVPQLQPVVSELVSFIRSPTWVTPEYSQQLARDGRNTVFTPDEIKRFTEDKAHLLDMRKKLTNAATQAYDLYYKDSDLQKKAFDNYTKLMRERLNNDKELCDKLIPKFEVGCRRLSPGHGFLESLTKPNTTVVLDEVREFNQTGIVSREGKQYDVDVIVCATGFDVSHKPAFPVRGRNGLDLRKFWEKDVTHYLSVAAPGFPNYYMVGGPNSTISNVSLIFGLEASVDYAYLCVQKMQKERIRSLEVRRGPTDEFLEQRNEIMKKHVWTGSCSSWYKDKSDGTVSGPWCGSVWHYREILSVPRWEDYDVAYSEKNRFSYFGMGRTRRELRGENMADEFLKEPDR